MSSPTRTYVGLAPVKASFEAPGGLQLPHPEMGRRLPQVGDRIRWDPPTDPNEYWYGHKPYEGVVTYVEETFIGLTRSDGITMGMHIDHLRYLTVLP